MIVRVFLGLLVTAFGCSSCSKTEQRTDQRPLVADSTVTKVAVELAREAPGHATWEAAYGVNAWFDGAFTQIVAAVSGERFTVWQDQRTVLSNAAGHALMAKTESDTASGQDVVSIEDVGAGRHYRIPANVDLEDSAGTYHYGPKLSLWAVSTDGWLLRVTPSGHDRIARIQMYGPTSEISWEVSTARGMRFMDATLSHDGSRVVVVASPEKRAAMQVEAYQTKTGKRLWTVDVATRGAASNILPMEDGSVLVTFYDGMAVVNAAGAVARTYPDGTAVTWRYSERENRIVGADAASAWTFRWDVAESQPHRPHFGPVANCDWRVRELATTGKVKRPTAFAMRNLGMRCPILGIFPAPGGGFWAVSAESLTKIEVVHLQGLP